MHKIKFIFKNRRDTLKVIDDQRKPNAKQVRNDAKKSKRFQAENEL